MKMKVSSSKTLHRRQTAEDFNEKRYGGEWQPGPSEGPRIQAILKLVGSGGKVLDVGCGDGTIGSLVAKAGNDVYGIDISSTAVRLARAKGIKATKIDLESEDVCGLPFDDHFFDVVLAAEIIEHFFDTDTFLSKIKRVLKQGGYLVLTTPNLASFGRRVLLFLGKNPLTETRVDNNTAGHVRYFTKRTLFELLDANGFKVVNFCSDVVNFNSRGTIYSKTLVRLSPTLGRTLIVKAKLED